MTGNDLGELFNRPLSDRARGFLREVGLAGGRLDLSVGLGRLVPAEECLLSGYLHISEDWSAAKLTGLGQAYLDRLMRAN
jgi:hypothetical protein